jgi:transposase
MDSQLLRQLYQDLIVNGKSQRPWRCTYDDNLILFIHAFGVLQNASMRWAHDRRNWPLWMRRLPSISYSEFMRRLARPAVQQQLAELNDQFRAQLPRSREKCVDGKPLTVGVYSKDPEAKVGLVAEGFWGRGYKLHAIVDAQGAVDAFCLTPLNAGEGPVARHTMLPQVDCRGVTLRGDANYDSNELYAAVAARGGRFIAPRRKPGTSVSSSHPQHPDRLRAIAELEHEAGALQAHRRHRVRIEQSFGHLTNLPFGLFALPNSVRRHRRVQLWVTAKITLYHLYLLRRLPHKAAA